VLPKSAYAALIDAEVGRVQATYLRKLQKALLAVKQAAEASPVATPALRARVQGEVHALQRDFDRWLRTLGDDGAAAAAAGAFHEHCAKGGEEVVGFNREHLLPKHVAAAAREARGVFDETFGLPAAVEARLPMAPERLVGEHTAALAAAEAHVRKVVAGEPDGEALLAKDALPGLRTHAELAWSKAEAANKGKLAGVAEAERGAYERARAAFEEDFFARLQGLKGTGSVVKEGEYLAAFDGALAGARRVLGDGLQGELTPAGRKAELEGFLAAAAEACKREQGLLYQLDCTETLLAAALGASASLMEKAGAQLVAAAGVSDIAVAQREFGRLKKETMAGLREEMASLAATDAGKAACLEVMGGVVDGVWALVEGAHQAQAAAHRTTGDKVAVAAAAAAEEERKKGAAAVARLEEEVKRLRAGAGQQQEAGAQAQARVRALEARVGELEGEKGGLEMQLAAAQQAVAAAREEAAAAREEAATTSAAAAAAAAAAAEAAASKKRKAEEEVVVEGEGEESPPAKSRRKGGKAAAKAAAEEEDGMEVDALVKEEAAEEEEEEEAAAPSPAPAAKGKKAAAAASKGRAASSKGKAAAAAAAAAATSPGTARSKLEKAREEERKRIEESMKKRVTRAGRGGK
jgi:trimeric autotransporter adhesin